MLRELKAHPIAYAVLIVSLLIAIVAFLAAWPYREWQRGVAVGFAGFYFIWGLLTHLHADHITRRIVLEYTAVSALIAIILIGLTV
jgi:hypothetical protein